MKTISRTLRAGLGFVLTGAFLTAVAAAQCGTPTAKLHQQAWRAGGPTAPLTQASDMREETIVGMWPGTLTSQGQTGRTPQRTPNRNAPSGLPDAHDHT